MFFRKAICGVDLLIQRLILQPFFEKGLKIDLLSCVLKTLVLSLVIKKMESIVLGSPENYIDPSSLRYEPPVEKT